MKLDTVVIKSGLRRHCDFMSLTLLNLVLEKVIRDMRIEPKEGVQCTLTSWHHSAKHQSSSE